MIYIKGMHASAKNTTPDSKKKEFGGIKRIRGSTPPTALSLESKSDSHSIRKEG